MADKSIIKTLVGTGLKVTPQRTAILEVIMNLDHPTAEDITQYLRLNFPTLSMATIYRTLDTFLDKGIIKRVKTGDNILRYDAMLERHHHLYSSGPEQIEDYFDEELNTILDKYFAKKKIPGFRIEDLKLQIMGKFTENK